ncbi:TetR/AcrR family transcriptional regulator [Paraburkholderia caballeronis]|uniref:TetR/AcrR family transcriptional regulator n=1 Tax=Paraburkholderia caballeronis TaxID=416943 RepID=UPI001064A6B6|nr:TetR/AcrR family transcriptional regulator [Paraburkholderia caballeronis]TDV13835.1 TetR family transcriptional regulator [Paraburkholderia caballeronis]TDV15349.1 TetR family transcriptional regulator [Paraburkholderia caballeronis]TDV24816.1 TetR family transcriptional regulator [Paraburkholderia caballeronis]
MARPKSDDKRNAILAAAARVIAEQGGSATTARIAKEARVAEGTLFTYFANKDDLLNQLYLDLKSGLRDVMLHGYPLNAPLRERAHHAWNAYVDWGISRPAERRAMARLTLSERITDASRKTGSDAFAPISAAIQEAAALGKLRDYPAPFVGAIMNSLAETTMDFVAHYPDDADRYRAAGFEAFWNAIAGG